LQDDPLHVGGWLSGGLHGKKSTRISRKYRLIFTPDEMEKVVYLNWIDHRKTVYDLCFYQLYKTPCIYPSHGDAPVDVASTMIGAK